jgi:hypothetical protein
MRHTAELAQLPAIGPLGLALTLADLPSPSTKRWVSRRKAEVVIAVHSGLLTLQEACERYALSQEEFLSWSQSFKAYGLKGLSATRLAAGAPKADRQ